MAQNLVLMKIACYPAVMSWTVNDLWKRITAFTYAASLPVVSSGRVHCCSAYVDSLLLFLLASSPAEGEKTKTAQIEGGGN